jgi:predicted DNA-binding protein
MLDYYRGENMSKENTVYIPLRLPESLKQQIETLAKEDSRSFNSYVKVLLEKHIKEKGGE